MRPPIPDDGSIDSVRVVAISIRAARRSDASVVAELRDSVAGALLDRGIAQWRPGEREAAHFRQLAACGHLYIAEDARACVGAFSCFLSDPSVWGPRPDDAVYVHDLMVHPTAQGRGYGAEILAWAERFAASRRRTRLRLDCTAENARLRAYYRSQGFAEVGEKGPAPMGGPPVVLLERPVSVPCA